MEGIEGASQLLRQDDLAGYIDQPDAPRIRGGIDKNERMMHRIGIDAYATHRSLNAADRRPGKAAVLPDLPQPVVIDTGVQGVVGILVTMIAAAVEGRGHGIQRGEMDAV